MTINEIYEFIGDLAIALYAKGIKLSLNTLRYILLDQNTEWTYANPKGMGSGVSAAYRYWMNKGDVAEHHAIAFVFTDKNGKAAWK